MSTGPEVFTVLTGAELHKLLAAGFRRGSDLIGQDGAVCAEYTTAQLAVGHIVAAVMCCRMFQAKPEDFIATVLPYVPAKKDSQNGD